MTVAKSPRASFRFTGDHALGLAGLGLATASAAFGIGMTVHGPMASFGTGKDFTVFAQLAPRKVDASQRPPFGDAVRSGPNELDMTATASIPKGMSAASEMADAAIIAAVTLEAVGTDSATVAVDGRVRVVHVGDEVPGAGQVIAIVPGVRPALRTSRGLIVPAAE